MRNALKKTITIALAILLLLTSGCQKIDVQGSSIKEQEAPAPNNLVIIVSNTMGNSGLHINDIQYIIQDSVETNGSISIISNEGSPRLIDTFKISIPSYVDNQKRQSLIQEALNAVYTLIQSITPQRSEVNIAASLDLAEKVFSGFDKEDDKSLIIISNGFSTSGLIDMTVSGFDIVKYPEAVIDEMNKHHSLPNLENVTYTWVNLGECEFPQKNPSKEELHYLTIFYESILEASGCSNGAILNNVSTEIERQNLPVVSAIEVVGEKTLDISSSIFLDESRVAFVPDTSNFLNPEEAHETLKEIALVLISNPVDISIFGTTAAYGDQASCEALSYERADRVRATLKEYGVTSDISIRGLGYEKDPWHIEGHSQYADQNNRKVVIMSFEEARKQGLAF